MTVEIKHLTIKGAVREGADVSPQADLLRREDLHELRRQLLDDCRRLFKEQMRRSQQR